MKPAVDDIHCAGCLVKERRVAKLKRENERLRGFLDTVMLNWEKHRVYKALLTAEEQEDK